MQLVGSVMSHPVEVAGECLQLRPDGTVFWPANRTLFVADVHLGKAATFRALGVAVPGGTTDENLRRLSATLCGTEAHKLVILGDLWHARQGRTDEHLDRFARWRREHASVEIVLVEGNHDLRAGRLPEALNIRELPSGVGLGPFVLCHEPCASTAGYVLAGHIHPGAVLEGPGRQAIKLPCFWFGPSTGVLPAFGAFTGCAAVRPVAGDQVLVIAGDQIVPVA